MNWLSTFDELIDYVPPETPDVMPYVNWFAAEKPTLICC
jgi:hypothetical protein